MKLTVSALRLLSLLILLSAVPAGAAVQHVKFGTHCSNVFSNVPNYALKNADTFVADQKPSVAVADRSWPMGTQIISFSNGLAVRGVPTRVFMASDRPAYLAFDKQAVSLLEIGESGRFFHTIDGQGLDRHAGGFSTPIGRTQRHGLLSDYSVDQLRERLGVEGRTVTIDFESGVQVVGEIEAFTTSPVTGKVTVITFKNKTTTVTFGVHKLFAPAWGPYDMLLL